MATSINKRVAEYILRAQNASDGGKRITELVDSKKSRRDNCAGYMVKDMMIFRAIDLIVRNKSSFKFAVVKDSEHVANFIVYFETRINGEKYQVSFHSFNMGLAKYVARSFRTKWDYGDSRYSAKIIYKHYMANGSYYGR